jgi:hypothetical protein
LESEYFQDREREQHYDGSLTEQDMDVTGIGRDLMLQVLNLCGVPQIT